VSWQQRLVDEVGKLGPEIETRVVSDPSPSDEVVAAKRFFDLDYLRGAIAGSATTPLHSIELGLEKVAADRVAP
jgi:hypothetical protein